MMRGKPRSIPRKLKLVKQSKIGDHTFPTPTPLKALNVTNCELNSYGDGNDNGFFKCAFLTVFDQYPIS